MAKKKTAPKSPLRSGPPLAVPLPEDGTIGSAAFWDGELEDAHAALRKVINEWKANLSRYSGDKAKLRGFRTEDSINVNVQFYTVENKRPQLFYQTPEVMARASRKDSEHASPLVQALINKYLGPHELHVANTVDEVLSDNLITAGIGAVKVGYTEVSETITVPTGRTEPVIDPFTGLAAIDPMTGMAQTQLALDPKTGQPETQDVPRVMWKQFFINRFSPADLRMPVGFTGANYDQAPWIGWRFNVDAAFAKQYGLDMAQGSALADELTLLDLDDRLKVTSIGTAYEIFYRAYLYDETERNPERIRRLVIVGGGRARSGQSHIVINENVPWQLFDDANRFIGGMKGFPIVPLCIRPLTERRFPKSDCSVLRDVADEKSMGRTLMVQQRKRNLPLRAFNKSSADPDAIAKLEDAEVQEMIGVTGDPRDLVHQISQASFPPENVHFDRLTQEDIDRLSASGSNQQGLSGEGETATEATFIQRASDTRLAKERTRVLDWFVVCVEKFFSILQLFADERDVIEMQGPDGAMQWREWTRQEIQGRFAFSLKPDSAIRVDAEQERQHYLRLFNLVSNHPQVDSAELVRQIARFWGIDPKAIVKDQPPQPPKEEPERPKLSLSIKGDDLNPMMPQYTAVVMLLKSYGVGVPEQPEPPGAAMNAPNQPIRPAAPPPRSQAAQNRPIKAAAGIPPVSQHDTDITGKLNGPHPS